jgi:hypothetical protein
MDNIGSWTDQWGLGERKGGGVEEGSQLTSFPLLPEAESRPLHADLTKKLRRLEEHRTQIFSKFRTCSQLEKVFLLLYVGRICYTCFGILQKFLFLCTLDNFIRLSFP